MNAYMWGNAWSLGTDLPSGYFSHHDYHLWVEYPAMLGISRIIVSSLTQNDDIAYSPWSRNLHVFQHQNQAPSPLGHPPKDCK
jgi:hypothetical protein